MFGRKRSYDLVSGKNKLQDKVNADLNAFFESSEKVRNEAQQVLDKLDVSQQEYAAFRSYHTTLESRLKLLDCQEL